MKNWYPLFKCINAINKILLLFEWQKYEYYINLWNECLVQLKKKYEPQFMELIDNKEVHDKTVISETRNEVKKYAKTLSPH